ncbi:MAG: hypothetical protein U5N55_01380 [Cypionkella sp.]|nr:hypothetical protein [Cypionkella sp.]
MAQNAPQMWQSQPHAAAQMVQLQGVTILPATQVQRHIANGGPVWPPNSDIMLRHCRDGMAVGTPPEPPADAPTLHLPRAVWGGFLDAHFGHFMAEHLSRIANAAAQMPTETFVFTVDPALGQGDLPKWMWDILAHIGVARGPSASGAGARGGGNSFRRPAGRNAAASGTKQRLP